MSIIVKGMEMPENCTRCDYIGLNVAIGCPVMSGTNGRATDCPLGALPDKHGRLVDADALIRNHFSPEHRIALSEANKTWMRKIINDAPTIVEAEGKE
jgi:hypothetical protein